MIDRDAWEDWDSLCDLLALGLGRGQLGVLLGAGVSKPFGLPEWGELVEKIAVRHDVTDYPGLPPDERAEIVTSGAGLDEQAVARTIQELLYDGLPHDPGELAKDSPLLRAIGSLTKGERRGRVKKVVTLNYDDLLERYLVDEGTQVCSIDEMPSLAQNIDVEVYHPHGLLPQDRDESRACHCMITRRQYEEVLGRSAPWRDFLRQQLSSHITLFIGLSGGDPNLSQILMEANEVHPMRKSFPFHSVRFAKEDDPRIDLWEARGVYCHIVADWDDVPPLIFDICKRAALPVNGGSTSLAPAPIR